MTADVSELRARRACSAVQAHAPIDDPHPCAWPPPCSAPAPRPRAPAPDCARSGERTACEQPAARAARSARDPRRPHRLPPRHGQAARARARSARGCSHCVSRVVRVVLRGRFAARRRVAPRVQRPGGRARHARHARRGARAARRWISATRTTSCAATSPTSIATARGRVVLRVRNDFAAGIVGVGPAGAAWLDEGLASRDRAAAASAGRARSGATDRALRAMRRADRSHPRAARTAHASPRARPRPRDGRRRDVGRLVLRSRDRHDRPAGRRRRSPASARSPSCSGPTTSASSICARATTIAGPAVSDASARSSPGVGPSGTLVLRRPGACAGDAEIVALAPGGARAPPRVRRPARPALRRRPRPLPRSGDRRGGHDRAALTLAPCAAARSAAKPLGIGRMRWRRTDASGFDVGIRRERRDRPGNDRRRARHPRARRTTRTSTRPCARRPPPRLAGFAPLQRLIERVPTAAAGLPSPPRSGSAFAVVDSLGASADALDVIENPAVRRTYVGVYHINLGRGRFALRLASSRDLRRWSKIADLDAGGGSMGTLRALPGGGFLLAYEAQRADGAEREDRLERPAALLPRRGGAAERPRDRGADDAAAPEPDERGDAELPRRRVARQPRRSRGSCWASTGSTTGRKLPVDRQGDATLDAGSWSVVEGGRRRPRAVERRDFTATTAHAGSSASRPAARSGASTRRRSA